MYSNVTPPILPDYNPDGIYSYEGYLLPALPEWDKETYPYAAMYLSDDKTEATLLVSSSSLTARYVGGEYALGTTGSGKCLQYHCAVNGDMWTIYGDELSYSSSATFGSLTSSRFIWSNVTIKTPYYTFQGSYNPSIPYPYSIIVFSYEKGQDDWFQAHLYYSATPFTFKWYGSTVVNSGTEYAQIYGTVDDTSGWTDAEEVNASVTHGLNGNVYKRIYTDHDILDSAGYVWLAAGKVTPVEEPPIIEDQAYSFKTGLALGLAGNPLPIKKEPVAYLYNGVRSPKLPEWDREQYPYATIVTTSTSNWGWDVWLIASQNPFCVRDINSRPYLVHSANENCIEYMIDKGDSDWGETHHTEPNDNSGWPCSSLDSIWTDYDVLYANGSLYLAASEPVPVYE